MSLFSRVKDIDAHHRLIFSGVAAGVVAMLTMGRLPVPIQTMVVWNVFCSSLVGLAWLRIATDEPATFLSKAKLQDSNRMTIFVSVLIAACISLFAVGYLLATSKGLSRHGLTTHVMLSFGTVICSWCLIHTIFTLRYAHIYYGDSDEPDDPGHAGGLQFPGEPAPSYMDFAYFSFVIGMTCQVSDVQISDRRMRRLALCHGLVSFAFNTAILALGINIVSGLFSPG